MKTLFLLILCVATSARGEMFVHGRGFFPVLVQVVDSKTGSPIKGATVRLDDLGAYKELETDPERQTKVLPETLGKPVLTDDRGVAVVIYFGGWSEVTKNGKSIYGRFLNGTVVVIHEGVEIFRSKLQEWAKANDARPGANTAPWIVVPFPPETRRRAQPESSGQPATKPADKNPAKVQPSTPTSKDTPR